MVCIDRPGWISHVLHIPSSLSSTPVSSSTWRYLRICLSPADPHRHVPNSKLRHFLWHYTSTLDWCRVSISIQIPVTALFLPVQGSSPKSLSTPMILSVMVIAGMWILIYIQEIGIWCRRQVWDCSFFRRSIFNMCSKSFLLSMSMRLLEIKTVPHNWNCPLEIEIVPCNCNCPS